MVSVGGVLSNLSYHAVLLSVHIPSGELASPAVRAVFRRVVWSMVCSWSFRSCSGQHSSLTWLLFVNKVEMPALA